jgi:hypothetical protein
VRGAATRPRTDCAPLRVRQPGSRVAGQAQQPPERLRLAAARHTSSTTALSTAVSTTTSTSSKVCSTRRRSRPWCRSCAVRPVRARAAAVVDHRCVREHPPGASRSRLLWASTAPGAVDAHNRWARSPRDRAAGPSRTRRDRPQPVRPRPSRRLRQVVTSRRVRERPLWAGATPGGPGGGGPPVTG